MKHLYNKAFFDWFVPHRHLYQPVADWITHHLSPDVVLDLGCGNGFFLDMIDCVACLGVEYTDAAMDAIPARIVKQRHDLTQPLHLEMMFDLVICTEVGEHLPPVAAPTLVDSIVRHAFKWVLFSAATPGQGGEGHLNEQPQSYWVDLFADRGFWPQWKHTELVRAAAPTELSWIRSNALVLSKDFVR